MLIERLCTPAVLYIGFSLIYIVIDIFSKEFVEAGVKFVLMIAMTTLLNFLCDNDFKITAYFIVFLPLMFMFYLSGLLIYIFGLPDYSLDYDLNKDVSSDSDTTSSDTTSGGIFSSILPNIPLFNAADSKCGEYCSPENTCVENCYINGCYKNTDEPNTCWEQYSKDLEGKYKVHDLELTSLTKSGRCTNNITEQDCKQYAIDNQFDYKGSFAYGTKYPEKCFIKDADKGNTAVYYNLGSGKECSKLQPCICGNSGGEGEENNESNEDVCNDPDICKSYCTYECYEAGCYKETDEPNTCWEKYNYSGEGCKPGTYCNVTDGAPHYGKCTTQYYNTDTEIGCKPCPANTYCNEGNCDTCTPCPQGQTSTLGSVLCS